MSTHALQTCEPNISTEGWIADEDGAPADLASDGRGDRPLFAVRLQIGGPDRSENRRSDIRGVQTQCSRL
jgi:hypothetical protein